MTTTTDYQKLTEAAHNMAWRMSSEPQDAAQFALLKHLEKQAAGGYNRLQRGGQYGNAEIGWQIRVLRFYAAHYEQAQESFDKRLAPFADLADDSEVEFGASNIDVEAIVAGNLLAEAIDRVLATMPDERRRVVRFYLILRAAGLEQHEAIPAVAQAFGKTSSNVWNFVQKATATLREDLAEWGE